MDLEHVSRVVSVAWIVAAGVVGLMANVSSLPAAVILAVVGFGPPIAMLLLWKHPQQTTTENVQAARR